MPTSQMMVWGGRSRACRVVLFSAPVLCWLAVVCARVRCVPAVAKLPLLCAPCAVEEVRRQWCVRVGQGLPRTWPLLPLLHRVIGWGPTAAKQRVRVSTSVLCLSRSMVGVHVWLGLPVP